MEDRAVETRCEDRILGAVTDVRALVWFMQDELAEATAAEEWDILDLALRMAGLLAAVLYVEKTPGREADRILAAFPDGVRAALLRLRGSGMLERGFRPADLVRLAGGDC